MKKLILSSLTISILMLIYFSSCVKSESDIVESSKSEQLFSPTNEGTNSASTRSNDNGVEVDCVGECDGSSKCYAIVRPTGGGTFECASCTECKMRLIYKNGVSDDYEYRSDFNKIGLAFIERLNLLHDGVSAKVARITMEHGSESEFIKYEYYFGDNTNEVFSVAYTTTFDEFSRGPTYEVDCSGTCGTQENNNICTEVFNAGSGEVYCKCESDSCKMTIKQI